MHICFVTETYPPEVNGVAMTMSQLVKGMLEKGHHVSLVRPRQQTYDRPGCCHTPYTTLVGGLPVPGYKGLHLGIPAGFKLTRLWRENKPDVIYIATEGPLGRSALAAAKRLGIPMLSGFHTNFHSYADHYHLGILKYLILGYLRRFHNQTSGTVVPNEKLAQILRDEGFENVSLLERGVDTRLFHPRHRSEDLRRAWGVGPEDPVYLSVGRVAAEKNIFLAIEAYRKARQENKRARLVVVGDGPKYNTLQKEHQDVIFCGMHTGKALARYYASADVFLFPSETETFGNVTMEALASGLVVVAYDYAAAQLHIKHKATGLLVPFGQSEQFQQASCQATQHSSPESGMRVAARNYAESVSWQSVYEKLELLLQDCLPDEALQAESA